MSVKSLKNKRSNCPIASALDVVGDRWTLLVIRDIGLFCKHRNKDFQNGAEGIPSNILAARLHRLVDQGLLERRLYQSRPPRYEYHLTAAGRALLPVVGELARWGAANIDGTRIPNGIQAG